MRYETHEEQYLAEFKDYQTSFKTFLSMVSREDYKKEFFFKLRQYESKLEFMYDIAVDYEVPLIMVKKLMKMWEV